MMRWRRPVIIEVLAWRRGPEAVRGWRRTVEVLPGGRQPPIIVRLGYSPCGGEDEQRGAREEYTHVISVKRARTGEAGT